MRRHAECRASSYGAIASNKEGEIRGERVSGRAILKSGL
jgi:hypothetical protein